MKLKFLAGEEGLEFVQECEFRQKLSAEELVKLDLGIVWGARQPKIEDSASLYCPNPRHSDQRRHTWINSLSSIDGRNHSFCFKICVASKNNATIDCVDIFRSCQTEDQRMRVHSKIHAEMRISLYSLRRMDRSHRNSERSHNGPLG
jgi:hypothetical protein